MAAICFQMPAERKVPVRLTSPFRHCCVLPTVQKHYWLPSSYAVRQSSLHASVFSSQFSGPVRPHLGFCSKPCPPACLSSLFPPSLPSWVQSVLDRHVLFPPLTVSDLLFQPNQQICFSHPPLLCQSASFSFLHSLSTFLVDIASPGPQSPHRFPPTLISFARSPAIPQTACPYLVTSCPLHFSQLSPIY